MFAFLTDTIDLAYDFLSEVFLWTSDGVMCLIDCRCYVIMQTLFF